MLMTGDNTELFLCVLEDWKDGWQHSYYANHDAQICSFYDVNNFSLKNVARFHGRTEKKRKLIEILFSL